MKVSVIIPIYNVERYLKRCLDSVEACVKNLENDSWGAEVICVDDGSTDGSADVLSEFEKKAQRNGLELEVIRQSNFGLSAARNAGMRVAKGDWITFVDSDDWVDPGYLIRLCSAVDKTGCDMAVIGAEWDECSVVDVEDYWCRNRCQATVAWGKLYRRALFSSVNFPEGRLHEDEFVTYRLIFGMDKVVTVKDDIYHYTISPGSIMSTSSTKRLTDELDACDAQISFFKGRFLRAYGLTLANRIRICKSLGCVDEQDVEEYKECTRFSINSFYWAEHYRYPLLVNPITWKVMRFFHLAFSGRLRNYLRNRR